MLLCEAKERTKVVKKERRSKRISVMDVSLVIQRTHLSIDILGSSIEVVEGATSGHAAVVVFAHVVGWVGVER